MEIKVKIKRFNIDSRLLWWALILISALAVRLVMLDARPPHHDEGVNGDFVERMWNDGYFNYDPTNFHGPSFFYLLQFTSVFLGRSLWAMRFCVVLLSLLNVYIVLYHEKFFGRSARWAALFMAFSASMVFYGRYAIHETLLITTNLIFSAGFFELVTRGNRRRALALMPISVFAAFATKETFFIFFACWALAWWLHGLFEKDFPSPEFPGERAVYSPKLDKTDFRLIAKWSLVSFLGAIVLYTGFFMDLRGILDMFYSFIPWFHTGGIGRGHDKFFLYYVKVLWNNEIPVLAVCVCSIFLMIRSTRIVRFWILLGLGSFFAYSLIPYKTPWLIINFTWPLFFVAGYGIEMLISLMRRGASKQPGVFSGTKAIVSGLTGLVAVLCICSIGIYQSWNINYRKYASFDQAFVYVHTDKILTTVTRNLDKAIAIHPELLSYRAGVYVEQTWPLPFVFRDWPVSYSYSDSGPVEDVVAVIDAKNFSAFEARLEVPYYKLEGLLREAYTPIAYYFRKDLFADTWTGPYTQVGPEEP